MKYVKKFHSKYGTELAIQLLPENVSPTEEYLEELQSVIGHNKWNSDRDGSIEIHSPEYLNVEPEEWLIRGVTGVFATMNDEAFKEEYEDEL